MWTPLTLGRDRRSRFSKTARSRGFSSRYPRPHRCELDTVGRDARPMAPAITGWGLAHDLAEGAAEGSQAREGDVEADVRDAPIALAQQEHGALHPPPLQVAVRGLAEHRAEAPAEVCRRDVGDRRDRADVQRLAVRTVYRIASAQQAPVEILGLAAHPLT